MKKVLVVGASGFLGKKIASRMRSEGLSVVGTGFSAAGSDAIRLDTRARSEIEEIIKNVAPDVVVDAHGMTSVDQCEKNPEEAHAINVDGTGNLSAAAAAHGAKYVYISTDYVFDGRSGEKYTETTPKNPINVYGKTKDKAEKVVMKHIPDALILRTSSIYGFNDKDDKSNFAKFVYTSLKAGKEVRCVTDQFTCPALIDDIAEAVIVLLRKKKLGIYHVVGSEFLSRHDFAVNVANVFGLDANLIKLASTSEMNFAAPRPLHLDLSTAKLQSEGLKTSGSLEGLRTMKRQMNL